MKQSIKYECPKRTRIEVTPGRCGVKANVHPFLYSNKTLVGHWMDDRYAPKVREIQPDMYVTTSQIDYVPKPLSKTSKYSLWDQKLKGQGSVALSSMMVDKHPNFYENFSTTYDLAYNHFPKLFKGTIPRKTKQCRELTIDEYLNTYGNITGYGLREGLKNMWEDETTDPLLADSSTEYKKSYKRYEYGIYKENHDIMRKIETAKPTSCNPITWSCNYVPKLARRCVAAR